MGAWVKNGDIHSNWRHKKKGKCNKWNEFIWGYVDFALPGIFGGVVWQVVVYINLKLMGKVLAIDIDMSGIIIYIVIETKRTDVIDFLGMTVRNTEIV